MLCAGHGGADLSDLVQNYDSEMNPRRVLGGLKASVEAPIEIRRLRSDIDSRHWDSIIVVSGMRRAGNHAVIGWLANAYESALAPIEYDWPGVGISVSGITAHLNDIPLREPDQRRKRNILRSQRQFLGDVKSSSRLILSTEDVPRGEVGRSRLLAGRIDARIHVSRSVLNLLASRLAILGKNPPVPDARFVRIDQAFLDRIAADLGVTNDGWVGVDFDRWSTGESSYRAALLEQLDLSVDIAPQVSVHGGGSSFTGKDELPESTDLHSRWERVEWPDDLLDLLALERNRQILTEVELDHLRDLRR
jgi:hypothetical protein